MREEKRRLIRRQLPQTKSLHLISIFGRSVLLGLDLTMELQGVLPLSPTIALAATPTSRHLSTMLTPNSPSFLQFPSRFHRPPQFGKRPLRSPFPGTTEPRLTATSKNLNPKDEDLVFVAGATGRVGSRTVRELLKLGFRVRAGVRDAQRAETLIQSVRQMKSDTESFKEGVQYVQKLDIVDCDLEKPEKMGVALGNASVIICCIGASEKEVFDVTGPYRIDYQASKNLIDAATVAKVDHFIFVSSLGTNKFGFPAAILNLFWGVLVWKRKAEEALIASGLPYTIVRPGGMERPTDSYKETHNLKLSLEDTLFGGQVSNLQVAELIAFMAKNPSLSYYKVVEVIAETTAPSRPFGELLLEIPSQNAVIYPSKDNGAASGASTANLEQGSVKGKPTELGPNRDMDQVFTFSKSSSTPSEKEPVNDDSLIKRPLSPYTAYDDLKPPTSPSPRAPNSLPASGGSSESATKAAAVWRDSSTAVPGEAAEQVQKPNYFVRKERPLSPYTMYDGMKPPSAPRPSSSGDI